MRSRRGVVVAPSFTAARSATVPTPDGSSCKGETKNVVLDEQGAKMLAGRHRGRARRGCDGCPVQRDDGLVKLAEAPPARCRPQAPILEVSSAQRKLPVCRDRVRSAATNCAVAALHQNTTRLPSRVARTWWGLCGQRRHRANEYLSQYTPGPCETTGRSNHGALPLGRGKFGARLAIVAIRSISAKFHFSGS